MSQSVDATREAEKTSLLFSSFCCFCCAIRGKAFVSHSKMHLSKAIILRAATVCSLLQLCGPTSAATVSAATVSAAAAATAATAAATTDKDVATTTTTANTTLNPIILVPGMGGSQIQYCNKNPNDSCSCERECWPHLWLAWVSMLPELIRVWARLMQLNYDKETHTTYRNGIEVRVPGFGDTKTIECIEPFECERSNYFGTMVKKLRKTFGYVSGENLHGAPYDFRKAPNEHGQYFEDLKTMVEYTYAQNGNKKVIFICHSMGSPMTLFFLNRQTQAWKDKYIKAFLNLAGAWGGTVRSMAMYILGDDFGFGGIVDSEAVRRVERTTPSLAWMMPSEHLWKPNEVLLQSPNVTITASNLNDFYKFLKLPDAAMMHDDTKDLVKDLIPPGVDTFCLHSSGVNTVEKLAYVLEEDPDTPPQLEMRKGDGDGTVNLRSLMACTEWKGKQKQKFHHKVFPKVSHLRMMHNNTVLHYVQNIIQELQDKSVASPLPEIEIL